MVCPKLFCSDGNVLDLGLYGPTHNLADGLRMASWEERLLFLILVLFLTFPFFKWFGRHISTYQIRFLDKWKSLKQWLKE